MNLQVGNALCIVYVLETHKGDGITPSVASMSNLQGESPAKKSAGTPKDESKTLHVSVSVPCTACAIRLGPSPAAADAQALRAVLDVWIDQIRSVSSRSAVASSQCLVSHVEHLVDDMVGVAASGGGAPGPVLNKHEHINRKLWRRLYGAPITADGKDTETGHAKDDEDESIDCESHCAASQQTYLRFVAPFVPDAQKPTAFVEHLVQQHHVLHGRVTNAGRDEMEAAHQDYDALVAALRWLFSEHLVGATMKLPR